MTPSDIGDHSLAPLRDLRHVESLQLDFQPITDEGIAYLSHLRSLKVLNYAEPESRMEVSRGLPY